MPSRDYYLKSEPNFAAIRAKYRTYIANLLALASAPNPAASADAILALETRIAELHWPAEKVGDRILTYNPKSRAQLKAMAPEFPWDAAFHALGMPQHDRFGAKEPDAIAGLARLFRQTPVAEWRAYMTFHYLNAAAEVLPQTFDELAFDFNGRTLSGRQSKGERWKRATAAVNTALGEAVGRLYVNRHFPPDAKEQVRALVENLRMAFRARIAAADWMSPVTRRAALRKLDRLRVKIGYPDAWRDYSTLDIRPDDALGNRARARLWDWRRRVARLDGSTDRNEWGMTPQTVNAYYNAFFNEVVFPAAILQAPYFDPAADDEHGDVGGSSKGLAAAVAVAVAVAIAALISYLVVRGQLRGEVTGELRAQAASIQRGEPHAMDEPLPGLHLNGQMTLSENIGDNSGLAVALDAYRLSLGTRRAHMLDGFNGVQRFFLSWSQTYREKVREAQLRQDVVSDPHSPGEFRVNGVVRNMDAWYEAFDVGPGGRLYLAPSDRVRVW